MSTPSFDINSAAWPLFMNYNQDTAAPQKYIAGQYMPDIQDTKQAIIDTWKAEYGKPLPEAAIRMDYTLDNETYDETYAAVHDIYDSLTPSERRSQGLFTAYALRLQAADTAKQIIADKLAFSALQPNLQFTKDLLQVPQFQNSANRYDGTNAPTTDCAVTVFGMNAAGIAETEPIDYQNFESYILSDTIKQASGTRPQAVFDLPWMLGSLTTPYAQDILRAKVRVVTSIGADFAEIEKRIIGPVQAKHPDISCSINAVLSSERQALANHMVAITAATSDTITVNDPKYKTPVDMPAGEFWKRWTPANMQAVIGIVKPL